MLGIVSCLQCLKFEFLLNAAVVKACDAIAELLFP